MANVDFARALDLFFGITSRVGRVSRLVLNFNLLANSSNLASRETVREPFHPLDAEIRLLPSIRDNNVMDTGTDYVNRPDYR